MAPFVLFYLFVEQGFIGVNVLIHKAFELVFKVFYARAEVKHG